MSGRRAAGVVVALTVLGTAGSWCAAASAGEFTVSLCQQRNRTLDGVPGQMAALGAGATDEHCEHVTPTGLVVTPPASGLAPGTSVGLGLQPAAGDAQILSAELWSDSTAVAAGLSLSIASQRGGQRTIQRQGTQLGGADQAEIGAASTFLNLRTAPADRLEYLLTCGTDPCAGGAGAGHVTLFGAALTILDVTPPALDQVAFPDGPLAEGGGVAVTAHDDGSGVQISRLLVDGREVSSTVSECDARLVRPCPRDQQSILPVDINGLGDGYHNALVQVVDYSQEVSQRAGSIYVDTRRVPVNRTPPEIEARDRPRAGDTLSATPGTWDGVVELYRYQWSRCDGDRCTPVSGAQGSRYHLTLDDKGHALRVDVVAARAGVADSAPASARTGLVEGYRLENRSPPNVGGSAVPGRKLTATGGEWRGDGTVKLAYRWKRCRASTCRSIAGATKTSYTVGRGDLGQSLRLEVTARDSSGATARATSEALGPVVAGKSAKLLPRPFVRIRTRVTGRAGEEFYRLVTITLGALEPGSRVEIACRTKCSRLGRITRRTVKGHRMTITLSPALQYVPRAPVTVSVLKSGRIGRIRHITLTSRSPVLEPMRCLAGRTGREERSCHGL